MTDTSKVREELAHEAWIKFMAEAPGVSQDVFRYLHAPFHDELVAIINKAVEILGAMPKPATGAEVKAYREANPDVGMHEAKRAVEISRKLMAQDRNEWQEMAAKLAGALKDAKFADFDGCPSAEVNLNRALAEYEAFIKRGAG